MLSAILKTYIEELSHTNVYREIISDDLWRLVNELYDLAAEKLQRNYDEKRAVHLCVASQFNDRAHFEWAVHLTSKP